MTTRKIRPALLPYQRKWVYDKSRFKLCEKSRRIGITWATAGEAVTLAGKNAASGGMDVWYMVSNEDDAKEFIRDCASWAKLFTAYHKGAKIELIEGMDDEGASENIMSMQINMASGFKIRALSSNPRRIRGKAGYLIVDEAAFHDDLGEILKAGKALMMQGGKIALISTHDGEDNPFNLQILEERKRREDGAPSRISLHRYTLDDALRDGFYEQIVCRRDRSAENTPEAKAAWRKRVVDDYGQDADEELFANPRGDKARILWDKFTLDNTRVIKPSRPAFVRSVVSVDPSGEDEGTGDDCGIICAGITGDDHIYVWRDETTAVGPRLWAQSAVDICLEEGCDAIVAEKNYGGKMVRDLVALSKGGSRCEYMDVVSKSSKYHRAKPIAEMHRKGQIHLMGYFPELETELTTWREGLPSPNRMDAFVQACTELFWPGDGGSKRDGIFYM